MPVMERKSPLLRPIPLVLFLLVTKFAAAAPAVQSTPDLGLRFTLAATGLPKEGRWKSVPILDDVNGDGFLDLAVHPRLGKGTRVWLGDGQGHWREASQGLALAAGSCGGGLDFGDVNQDGKLDLAVADHCTGVFVFLGDGQGQWRMVTSALNPGVARKVPPGEPNPFSGAEHLALGDINQDGRLDLVVSASDRGGFAVYMGDGQGRSWKEMRGDGLPSADDPEIDDLQQGGWANKFLLHDMDGDSHLDVVASYYIGPRVWRGNGKGQWTPSSKGLTTLDVGGSFWGVTVGDINDDGRTDLVVASILNGPQVFLQQADRSWQKSTNVMPDFKGGAWSNALGDLDGDGHLDMVVGGKRLRQESGGSYGLFALRGDGNGGWTEVADSGLPTAGIGLPWGIALSDVNGDNRLDIVATTNPLSRMPLLQGNTGNNEHTRSQEKQAQVKTNLPQVQVWLNQTYSSGVKSMSAVLKNN